MSHGQEAWGHVVAKLLSELPGGIEVPGDLPDKARVLDAHYVATRYPNGHAEGAPFEHYGGLQSDEAIHYAGRPSGSASTRRRASRACFERRLAGSSDQE